MDKKEVNLVSMSTGNHIFSNKEQVHSEYDMNMTVANWI